MISLIIITLVLIILVRKNVLGEIIEWLAAPANAHSTWFHPPTETAICNHPFRTKIIAVRTTLFATHR